MSVYVFDTQGCWQAIRYHILRSLTKHATLNKFSTGLSRFIGYWHEQLPSHPHPTKKNKNLQILSLTLILKINMCCYWPKLKECQCYFAVQASSQNQHFLLMGQCDPREAVSLLSSKWHSATIQNNSGYHSNVSSGHWMLNDSYRYAGT